MGGPQQPVASSSSPQKRKRSLSPTGHDRPNSSSSVKRRVVHSSTAPTDDFPRNTFLLALPNLLAVPPNHCAALTSYAISLAALRRAIALGSLSPDEECRAWTGVAELGFRLAKAGWAQESRGSWAKGVDMEVETAIGKGLVIAKQNPSLAVYKQILTLTQAQRAHWLQNDKFARALLKHLSSDFALPKFLDASAASSSKTPSWVVYTTHLTVIANATTATPPDLKGAFSALQTLLSAAEALGDTPVRLLTHVLRLRMLVDAAMWDSVQDSLFLVESTFGLSYDDEDDGGNDKDAGKANGSGYGKTKEGKAAKDKNDFIMFEDACEVAMVVHTLIMGVIFYTHMGRAMKAASRLTHLHSLLDTGVLMKFPNGTISIELKSGPPLIIKCTHPHVLFRLAYLVSSASKRDAAGRKPKRKVFAVEGIAILESEVEIKKEVKLNVWAEPRDADEVEERTVKMKADLLSEQVAVCIMRSEFEEAAEVLDKLTVHTRAFDLFHTYAARITLHHAHLAHALGSTTRAAQCYAVAAHLAAPGSYVHVSARAGGLALRIGSGEALDADGDEVKSFAEACVGLGATMEAIGHVVRACCAGEIQAAKKHLKEALTLCSKAQDNHLRALVLALYATLYLRTAGGHARTLLTTAAHIALTLGGAKNFQHLLPSPTSPPAANGSGKKDRQGNAGVSGVTDKQLGNAQLGLWVGERVLELSLREHKDEEAKEQRIINGHMARAVAKLPARRTAVLGSDCGSSS